MGKKIHKIESKGSQSHEKMFGNDINIGHIAFTLSD